MRSLIQLMHLEKLPVASHLEEENGALGPGPLEGGSPELPRRRQAPSCLI